MKTFIYLGFGLALCFCSFLEVFIYGKPGFIFLVSFLIIILLFFIDISMLKGKVRK